MYRRTPARSAASANSTAAPRSTVSLRALPLPGPAPAAKTAAPAALKRGGDLLGRGRLQVEKDRFGTGFTQVVALLRSADDARDLVSARRQQPFETECDLTVSSSDDNAHAYDGTSEAPGSLRDSPSATSSADVRGRRQGQVSGRPCRGSSSATAAAESQYSRTALVRATTRPR